MESGLCRERVYAWQSPLQEAIHEHNPDEMRAKIRQAEVAVIGRIMAVSYRLDYMEEEALCEALARIRFAQKPNASRSEMKVRRIGLSADVAPINAVR